MQLSFVKNHVIKERVMGGFGLFSKVRLHYSFPHLCHATANSSMSQMKYYIVCSIHELEGLPLSHPIPSTHFIHLPALFTCRNKKEINLYE